MGYFLPSFLQKRILRYALSRLDLLETHDLNLDNLDVVFGKRSTIELRDIGVSTHKLASLLHLPAYLTLAQARILLLRITVPADLYNSGIVVEIEGVSIQLRTHAKDEQTSKRKGKSESSGSKLSKKDGTFGPSRGARPSRQSFERAFSATDLGNRDDHGINEGDALPTTLTLAQSFLQSEAPEERAEIEAAVADSQNLDQSEVLAESAGDATTLGIGSGFSLPGFLADFLQGIRDRLHIIISDIDIRLDTQIELPNEGSSSQANRAKWGELTIRVSIEKVDADCVTSVSTTRDSAIRRISIGNIQGMLISDPSLFSTLSRFSVPPSPVVSQTSPSKSSSSKSRSSVSRSTSMIPSRQSRNLKHQGSIVTISPGPTTSEIPSDYTQPLGGTLGSDSDFHPQGLEHSLEESRYEDGLTGSFHSRTNYDHQSDTTDLAEGRGRPHWSYRPSLGAENLSASQDPRAVLSRSRGISQEQSSGDVTRLEEDLVENLSESKIFSHEEAQSMYMSAMSHDSFQVDRGQRDMPGNWGSSSSEEDLPNTGFSVSEIRLPQVYQDESAAGAPDVIERIPAPTRAADLPLETLHRDNGSCMIDHDSSNGAKGGPIAEPSSSAEQRSPNKSEGSSSKSDPGLFIVKKIISIDNVTVDIPQLKLSSNHKSDEFVRNSQSSSDGSGHTSYEQPMRLKKLEIDHDTVIKQLVEPLDALLSDLDTSPKPSTYVQCGNVRILGDIDLTKLTIMVLQRFMELASQNSPSDNVPDTSVNCYDRIEISLSKLCWQFLDNVKGFTTSESQNIDAEARVAPMSEDTDILLKATIEGAKMTVDRNGRSRISTFALRKFMFGYEHDAVLAFNSGLKLRESNRDMEGPIGSDIVLKVSESPERTHIELTTLPLYVHLDLRRLDETFGWFGGFSSILGLGSSMISTVTATEAKSRPPNARHHRGVHFANTAPSLKQNEVSTAQHKITARLGGIVFDLDATSATFRLETSAVKVVNRAEGIGLSIDRLHVTGPYNALRTREPSISLRFVGLRAEYLSNPKEVDLTRLLALLCPSKDNFEHDDDILVDTLLRQRQQGGVFRINVDRLDSKILEIMDLKQLPALGDDLKKLSSVAKYLPEDDRPGIMTLLLIRDTQIELQTGNDLGIIQVAAKTTEAAHVSLPSLTALSVTQLEMRRNDNEELLGMIFPNQRLEDSFIPMVMARFIGNELEPTIKLKLQNLRFEYHVSTVLAALGLPSKSNVEQLVSDMIASIVTVTAGPEQGQSPARLSAQTPLDLIGSKSKIPSLMVDVMLRDVIIALNPQGLAARGIVVLLHTHINGSLPRNDESRINLEMNKASFLAIDDPCNLISAENSSASAPAQAGLVQRLLNSGYVALAETSAMKATLQILGSGSEAAKTFDVELRDALVVIETCADSTQTLQMILNGLQPPMPPSQEVKYRTEVMPVEDMLASFSGDAVATGRHGGSNISRSDTDSDSSDPGSVRDLDFVSSFYGDEPDVDNEDSSDSMTGEFASTASSQATLDIGESSLNETRMETTHVDVEASALDFREDHFGNSSTVGGTAHRWDTRRNTYELANDLRLQSCPLKLRLRGIHVIWNLFDGYDWARTRETIGQAVAAVEGKAMERRSRRNKRRSLDVEEEEDSIIGDFLFNSIYIGISGNQDPKDLRRQINRNIDDLISESESYATSTSSSSPSRQGHAPSIKSRRLRLMRSKSHKMTFELKGLSTDFLVFPPGQGEAQSSIDIRVQELEIFDHLPTSTWRKFATYMQDAGERESGTSMVHIEILHVKPVPDLPVSEIILKATVLPLRLHVDQDALDFMTRFFEFRDGSAVPSTTKSEPPFIQRAEVKSIRVKLDFKPKRVDYAGLRSGHTTEFMNFFILDQADMVLKRVIVHGVSGFDKLGKMLNDLWTPDVKNNQLPGVLASLAPIRSIANVGGGVRDLVVVPIREYKKDGRVVRSIQKGALAFAKTTTNELAKLGAKLAIGTQTVLQGAEDLLAPEQQQQDVSLGWEEASMDEEEKKHISLYADQPVGVMQGLRGGYASLERDLLMAKDAIIAIPGEVMDSSSAGGAARAVLRNAPTVILRPALGVSKAVGQTLMGATNSLDPANRRRIDEKYKRH